MAYTDGLNAPDGAGCFPTPGPCPWGGRGGPGLNAPDGAGCFPTLGGIMSVMFTISLNAPDGAGCFPTHLR